MATETTHNVEQELLELEKRFWQALKDKDVGTAVALTDFPVVVTGAQGVGHLDQDSFAAMMAAPSYTMRDFKLGDDAEVRLIGDDIAIVAYKAHEELTVDGEPVSLDVSDASTWVRRDGQWRCALHTESITGDPFGRDRQPRE